MFYHFNTIRFMTDNRKFSDDVLTKLFDMSGVSSPDLCKISCYCQKQVLSHELAVVKQTPETPIHTRKLEK